MRRGLVNYSCVTQKQHFNYLRNNSMGMNGALTWGGDQLGQNDRQNVEFEGDTQFNQTNQNIPPKQNISSGNRNEIQKGKKDNKGRKQVSFEMEKSKEKKNAAKENQKKIAGQRTGQSKVKPEKKRRSPSMDAAAVRIREQQQEQSEQQKIDNRGKVEKYIQDLRPYTRTLTNSKFQQLFDKAALQTYGRANTNQPIGGVIYGNHLKTFNMNPHIRSNEPKYYQTHTTAINFGKRTKLNKDNKWVQLEKQLTKKLGLKDKNTTLKQGKQAIIVDVDEDNMYDIMRQNASFKKSHFDEIRDAEKQYKQEKQQQKQDQKQQFYRQKQQKINKGLTGVGLNTSEVDRDCNDRLREQVIYKMHDDKGNVRYAADRHGLTCFVDMNFPENDAAYTEELRNRMLIFPIQVKNKDKFIDEIRQTNHQKSLSNVYPSHYLLPNCEQPQVLKMLQSRVTEMNKKTHNSSMNASTIASRSNK